MTSRFFAALRAEFRKFFTVRSSLIGLGLTVGLTIGLGALICWVMRQQYSHLSIQDKLTFDPLVFSFAGVFIGQFTVGVVGAQFITSEFATGSLHTTLAAVPSRWTVLLSKIGVIKAVLIVTSLVSAFVSFFLGQAILAGPGIPVAHFSDSGVPRQVLLTAMYLVLLGVFATALGFILRQTAATISVFVVVLLVVPIIDALMPSSIRDATFKYLPSSLGRSMMSGTEPYVYPLFSPWTSTFIFIAYIVISVAVAGVIFSRRDA